MLRFSKENICPQRTSLQGMGMNQDQGMNGGYMLYSQNLNYDKSELVNNVRVYTYMPK